MRWWILLLLVPGAAGEWVFQGDAHGDQAMAPLYSGHDVAWLNVTAASDGLHWSARAHGLGPSGLPPMDWPDDVRFHAELNGTPASLLRSYSQAVNPPQWDGVHTHPEFGPAHCVFKNVFFETLQGNTTVDRVPDTGSLTYDACWLFGIPTPPLQGNVTIVDALDDQASPRGTMGSFDISGLGLSLGEQGVSWGVGIDPGLDPTMMVAEAVVRLHVDGTVHDAQWVCRSLPPACFGGTFQAEQCIIEVWAESVWVNAHEQRRMDRVPDAGPVAYSVCPPEPVTSEPPPNTAVAPPPMPAQEMEAQDPCDGEAAYCVPSLPWPVWGVVVAAIVVARR